MLEPPLQIHKPNKFKIISMDIPICKGDLCYCVDVLDALTKDFFARKGNPVEETAELGEVTAQADRPGYEPISSTLWRQREEYCARMIQSVWRKQLKFTADTVPPPRKELKLPPPPAELLRPQRRASEVRERLGRTDTPPQNEVETIVTLESER